MRKRIKALNPNFRLMGVSLLLAVTLWYMINYFSDPAIRMTVNNVSVQLLHEEVIENRGDVYTVLDSTDVIPVVTVQAKRSVIDKLESKNIIATADARMMEEDGSIPIVLTTDKYTSSIERITGSISSVLLRVEPLETKSMPLEVDAEGTPAEGYVLYETETEQNQVDISGPQSYVRSVGRAAARVDIGGAERSINSYPAITLYDEEGQEITSEEMAQRKLHLNISSVKVTATIYQTKEVAITCGREVPLADGYELVSDPAAEPSSVLVAGAAGSLRGIDAIEIPSSDIASAPVSSNIHKQIDLEGYLPDGIVLPEGSETSVTVFVQVIKSAPQKSDESDTSATSEAVAADDAESAE